MAFQSGQAVHRVATPAVPENNEFVVLPYEEYEAMRQRLEDAEDLLELRKARRQDDPAKPGLTLEQLKARLGLKSPARKSRRSNSRTTKRRNRRTRS